MEKGNEGENSMKSFATSNLDGKEDEFSDIYSQDSGDYLSDETLTSVNLSTSSRKVRRRSRSKSRRISKFKACTKTKKRWKTKKMSSLKKGSIAFKNQVNRVSFLGSGIHFEPLEVMEQRALMKKIRKKKLAKEKLKSLKSLQNQKLRKSREELFPAPPGPATYNVSDSRMLGRGLSKYSGIFSKSKPKSEIDWTMYYAKDTPGPNAYPRPKLPKRNGGKFNESKPKSNIEWTIYRAKQLPGPSDYKPRPMPLPKGGRISTAVVKSEIDWIQYFAKDTPGPNAYPRPALPKKGGGRFNSGNGKSEIEWIVYYNKDTPGPATYGMLPTPKIGGGRFNESQPKSELEWIQYRAKQIPGPNSYDPKVIVDGEYFDARKTIWKRGEENKRSPDNMRKTRIENRVVSPSEKRFLKQTVKDELYSVIE
jgi:hypothetical protein